MKKPWFVTAFTVFMSLFLRCGIVARVGLVAAVFVGLFLFPAQAHAARTVTSATLNGGSSVTVAPGATITAAVNVTTTGTGSAARWRSTGWRIAAAPGAVTCVNHANYDSAGAYSETFSITAPATSGTYNAYFIAYNNDSCSSGASATSTMTGAVIVAVTNPVPTTTSISPASKNVGDGAFTMTVNGTNFVSGSVVRFNGLDRTTTYVSATQLTASIPASDMTTVGTFNITAFNPTPGGGTSNAQTFTVTTAFPTATTNAASDVTTVNNGDSWAATLNGIVSSNGADTTVTFEYGLTAAYGTSIAATPGSLATGAVNTAVSATLDWWLNCNTTFHYRVKATNSAGTSYGLDSIFTTGSCPGAPFSATDCAATRFGSNLVCTANDVNLTGITVAPGSVSSCVSGTPVTLDIDMTVNFATPDRWDIGIFIANDGKLPTQLPANGGASSCTVDILPITPPAYGYKFPDLDGEPMGTPDTCGDGNSAINVGTGSGVKRMTGVTIPCYATPDSGGKLFVPFVVSWDNQKSPIGGVCTSNQYPVPNTTSKCNAPLSSVPINVVVLPKINKTHSGASFNSGNLITYTITVFNDSGGTLQASFFKDPVVTGLTVDPLTGLSCTAANGATCPIANNTVADMQGPTGIPIPSANLPNNSSLIFTVTGRLSGDIGQTISNMATVSIGLNTNTSTDSVTLGSASGSKSFSPAAITEGNNSLMTITFTNPTASAVTGVSFLDTYPSGLVNAASPGESTSCGGTVTAIAGGNTLAFSGGTIPANGGSCNVSVSVTSATANNYINSVSFTPGSIGSASAALMVNAAGGSFVFTYTACQHGIAFGVTGQCSKVVWPAQTAGVDATAVYITAINTSGVPTRLHTTQDRTRNMQFGLSCHNPVANAGITAAFAGATNFPLCQASGATPTSWSDMVPVTFTGGLPSSNVSYTFNYADVGLVELWMRNSAIPTDTGNSGAFVVKPGGFVLSGIQQTAAPKTPNPAAAGATGAKFVKAGEAFGVTVTATTCSPASATCTVAGAPTPNYGKETTPEGVKLTSALAAGLGLTINPAIGGTFGAFANGAATGTAFTWNEAGIITLTPSVADANYLGAGDIIGTQTGNVGRFYAAQFALSGGVIANRTALAGCSAPAGCDTFTYMGEQMSAVFNLTAKAVNGTTTLQNYNYSADAASNFAKLDPAATGNPLALGAVDTGTPRTVATLDTTTYGVASGSFAGGIASITAPFAVARGASPSGPFDALDVGVAPVDGDSAALVPLDLAVNADGAPNTHGKVGSTKARYGRMKISNAHGSELLNLPVPMEAQYWQGQYWAQNSLDDATTIVPNNIKPGNAAVTINSIAKDAAGKWRIVLNKLLTPGTSSVCLDLDIGAPGDTSCQAATPLSMPYLQTGAAFDKDPVSRATFGVYKGNNEFIYLREMY